MAKQQKQKLTTMESDNPPKEVKVSAKADNVYTYVGGGEASPHKIHFMGKQHFTRGVATSVEDPAVLAKIKDNPSFTLGEVDMSELHDYDEEAAKETEEKRKRDAIINAAYLKKHGGEK